MDGARVAKLEGNDAGEKHRTNRCECGLPSTHRDACLPWKEGCIWVDQIYAFTSKRVILLGPAISLQPLGTAQVM